MIDNERTDFGFKQVNPQEKTHLVDAVFSSVASKYDLMNDLMSFGVHRFWKRYAVHILQVQRGAKVLDVAGGTGDMSALLRPVTGNEGRVVISDINADMLNEGRNRLLDRGFVSGIDYVQANAEYLPFENNYFDHICMAFGLRNVTDKSRSLESMWDKLKYGGSVMILEFSKVVLPVFKSAYDRYSFNVIPVLGKLVTRDRSSYEYLVESIRKHPDQETLKGMMEKAGFSNVSYYNLSGGIVAIHKGYKI